jgi:tetratricopeptide (TPR) repeat protein
VFALILALALAAQPASDSGGALAQAVERAAPASMERADALVALAQYESGRGQYDASIRHAREAAEIFAARGNVAGQALALNRIGQSALYAGDYASAGTAFRSAFDLSLKSGDHAGQAEHLTNLGNVYFFQGRYTDAARTYDEALALTEAAGETAWAPRRRRLALVNKATLFQRLSRDEEALAVYKELDGTGDLRPEEQAQLLGNLGVLYRRLGDPVKALATYDEAQNLFARARHVDGELGVLKNRGIVLALDLNRLDEAERTFSEVLSLATTANNRREMLHARVYRGEAILRAGQAERARDDFSAGAALAREMQTPEEEWKALYGLGRSEPQPDKSREYLTQAVLVIEQVRERIRIPSLRSDFFNDKREVYDALIAAVLRQAPSPAEIFNLVERSHSRAWRERLGLSGSVDLAAVQQTLAPGVLLLDYWSSPGGSALVAVTRTRAEVLPIAPDPSLAASLIDRLSAGTGDEWRASARALSAQVLPPSDWLDGVTHVIVVVDGALALVPFELLTIGDRLLVERAAVSYTPTAATLLSAAPAPSGWAGPWRQRLRAFGDPVFSSAALDRTAPVRERLAASAREVHDVASELAGRSTLHLGSDDRKAYLYEASHPPVLHFATHAVADATAIEQSRLLFSPAAGAQGAADYLFLKEAYDLPLTDVELAVLSACETERGRMTRGEGVQSFSRAFLAAGARSTVTTLWRVQDGPTADFMRVFYHSLQQGMTRAEALRRAKLRFLESGTNLAHPHYWAAFVLTGDGTRPLPRVVAWSWVAWMSAVPVVVGLTITRRWRKR